MLRALPAVLVLAVLSLAFAVPAHAVLITVNFTVTGAAGDPVNNGVSASGSFSFDSSIIPPGGGPVPLPVISGFTLNWDGTSWTDANTTSLQLEFDGGGNLTKWNMYGDPNGTNLIFGGRPGDTWPDDFALGSFGTNTNVFWYAREDVIGLNQGTLTWSVDTGSAPEPASWLLLGGALVGLVGVRQRARK